MTNKNIVLDIFAIYRLADKDPNVSELKKTGYSLAQKFVFDKIPRYQEKQKQE